MKWQPEESIFFDLFVEFPKLIKRLVGCALGWHDYEDGEWTVWPPNEKRRWCMTCHRFIPLPPQENDHDK
jgi:hypothetical protein